MPKTDRNSSPELDAARAAWSKINTELNTVRAEIALRRGGGAGKLAHLTNTELRRRHEELAYRLTDAKGELSMAALAVRRQWEEDEIRPAIQELERRAAPAFKILREVGKDARQLYHQLGEHGISDADPLAGEVMRLMHLGSD
jgi:hypothetical protein